MRARTVLVSDDTRDRPVHWARPVRAAPARTLARSVILSTAELSEWAGRAIIRANTPRRPGSSSDPADRQPDTDHDPVTRLTERLRRLTFRLPGFSPGIRRALLHAGEVSFEEGRFLGDLVRRAPPDRPIIEIGTLFGSSTRIIATFKRPETRLITVDSFRWNPHGLTRRQHESITREVLKDLGNHNVQLVNSDKADFYRDYRGPAPGLVFLDANHGYQSTLDDLRWATSIGSAIISGHDYKEKFPGVIRAVADSGGLGELVGSLFVLQPPGDVQGAYIAPRASASD